ncbi:MAG: O-antigen ligase family protein [Phycisphaerales bacterium]|nr:MAG: O-antigen ligase family protein [Phycisphaerales bacterium]
MAKTRTKAKSVSGPSRLLEYVLLGLCLCVVALRATYTEAPTASTSTLPGSLADTVYSLTLSAMLIFALMLWLLLGIWRGQLTYRVTGIEIGLGLFLLAAVLAGLGAADKRLAITHVMMLLGPIVGAILLVQLLDSAVRIRLVLLTVAALGVVSTYQCTEQRLVSNEITIEQYEKSPETLLEPLGIEPGSFQHFLFEHRLYSRGIRGFFTTSNSAASFALMAAFAAVAILLTKPAVDQSERTRTHPLLYPGLAAAIVVAGLLLTQSKGGILAGVVAASLFGLWVVLRPWLAAQRKTAMVLFGTLAVLAISAVSYAAVSYGLKHGRLPGGNSMLVRWQYWRASAQMIADHPLTGVGPGNFAHSYPRYKPAAALESVADPHNFLLSILAQYGPLGLVAFLAMVFIPLGASTLAAARGAAAQVEERPSSGHRLILTMLGVIIGALLLIRPGLIPMSSSGANEVVFYEIMVLYVAPIAAFLIGFLMLAAPLGVESTRRTGPAWAPIVVLLACAVIGVLVHNLIDFALFEPGVWTAFWMLIACLIAAGIQRRGHAPSTMRGLQWWRVIAPVVVLGIIGAYRHFAWQPVYVTTSKIQRAQFAASWEDFERAHRLLDAAAAADPLSSASLSLNGRLYLQRSESAGEDRAMFLKQAVTCFETAADLNPADYKNFEKAGIAHRRLGQNQKAYDWYLQAAERYPGRGRLHFQLGQIADDLSRPIEAREHYAEAVRIEDAFRNQFREMYPDREQVVSRLGEPNYRIAQQRLTELSP